MSETNEERSERVANHREATERASGVLVNGVNEGSRDERSESLGERSEP